MGIVIFIVSAKDTTYKLIVTTEDNPTNDTQGAIDNEKLQLRLIEQTPIWDEEKKDFIVKETVAKVIPLEGGSGDSQKISRTKVIKNLRMIQFIFILQITFLEKVLNTNQVKMKFL